jgi:hypothetical protein
MRRDAPNHSSRAALRRVATLVLMLVAVPAPIAPAQGAPPRPPDDLAAMVDRLERLEERIDALASDDGDRWLAARRSQDVRALVHEVLADADRRATALEDDVTAGYRKRIFLASPDGDFKLEVWGYLQQRYSASIQHDSPEDDTRSGFEIRRAKIKTAGRMFGDKLRFTTSVAYDDDTNGLELQGTTIQYHFNDETFVKVGRFRSPLLREEQVSSRRHLLAERSLVARAFVQNRTLGVALVHQDEQWGLDAAVMASREDLSRGQNWIVSLRAVRLLYGRMKDLRDFTSFPEDEPLLAVGGGVYYQDEESFGPDSIDFERFRWTVDLAWEHPGMSFFFAVIGNHEDRLGDGLDQYGAVVQAGRFLTDRLEVAARYEWGDADRDVADLSVVTIGLNYYVAEQDLKFTADIGYGINPVQSPWDSDGASWRRDRPGKDGQVVVRAQWLMQF